MHPLPVLWIALTGCPSQETENPATTPVESAYDRVSRADFNRIAVQLDLPLFWVSDDATPGTIDPSELAVLLGPWSVDLATFVDGEAFTEAFRSEYDAIASVAGAGFDDADAAPEEIARRAKVRKELEYARATLMFTDFTGMSEEDRAIVGHLVAAGRVMDRLYLRQTGGFVHKDRVAGLDPASRMLFWRNHGPWCESPGLDTDPECNALPDQPPRLSGLYPVDLQEEPDFCKTLEAQGGEIVKPFSIVVRAEDGSLVAVPYTEAYPEDMAEAADALKRAAGAIRSDSEAGFKAYLLAAAQAFGDNDWFAADAAWAAMGETPSRWYLRIGPDEVLSDPCNRKANFHMSLALLDEDAAGWSERLEPVKAEMEAELASLAGPPYVARRIDFKMPDFIKIVLNAGESRMPFAGTLGQSLPNWGPVAEAGGRTVVMTNLYVDPDSLRTKKERVESLFCEASAGAFKGDREPGLVSTLLHEAAHNLGPEGTYLIGGKTDDEVFGGGLATVMEELKAQTSALYLSDWLAGKGIAERSLVEGLYADDLAWAMGKIAGGMVNANGSPEPYAQLAAIQLGYLLEKGAVEWKADQKSADGKEQGCFEIHDDRMPAAVKDLFVETLRIKAKGDKVGAEALQAKYVTGGGDYAMLRDETIRGRWLRTGHNSFVYAVRY